MTPATDALTYDNVYMHTSIREHSGIREGVFYIGAYKIFVIVLYT